MWLARTSFIWDMPFRTKILLSLDSGHFHPTEIISDKISSILLYVRELLLHVSRGVRWDSDHVVTLNDELQAIMQEIVRAAAFEPRSHWPGFLRCQH